MDGCGGRTGGREPDCDADKTELSVTLEPRVVREAPPEPVMLMGDGSIANGKPSVCASSVIAVVAT